jgi:hypothetical protein
MPHDTKPARREEASTGFMRHGHDGAGYRQIDVRDVSIAP